MNARCAIMSDSTCDLSASRAADLGVGILPFHYTEPNVEEGGLCGDDDLFTSMSAHDFYGAIRAGACPMTSQPSPLEFEQAFEDTLARKEPAVLFCISSGLSGGYEGASTALRRVCENHPESADVPVRVIDTYSASTPMNLLVEAACERRDAGMSADEIAVWAEEARWRLQTLFMVDDLDALHRGGRVPKTVATIGGALDVKPLLTFDLAGKLAIAGMSRGRRKGLRKLAQGFLAHRAQGDEGLVVAIGDADCPEDGDMLADMIRDECPNVRVLRSTIGPTIGSHVGPGMVSCCYWGKDRRA